MKRIIGVFIVCFCIGCYVFGGEAAPRGGWLRYSPFGQSLLADVHPNFVRMDVGGCTNRSEWDWGQTGKRYRFNTFGVIGVIMPVWYGNFADGKYALSVGSPISMNIWLDLGEPTTAPVVDTDYRIALPQFTFTHRLNMGFAQNYSITFNPFKHESTHLGDELALQHSDHGLPLRRVNVSCNYSQLDFAFNEPENHREQYHTFKLGLMVNWDHHGKWYFIDKTDGDASLARPRISPWEAWLQYQYQSPSSKHGFQGVASIEIRNRPLFGYPQQDWSETEGVTYTLQDEKRIFTYNVYIGARYNCPTYTGCFSQYNVGIRLYHGNNPYGQFRNYDNFNQVSFCIIVQ